MPGERNYSKVPKTFDSSGPAFIPAGSGQGDDAVFSELYEKWYTSVVGVCRRQLGSVGDAEAVAQEALVRAWLAFDRLGDSDLFWPWVVTIARRLCINEAIAVRRRRERETMAVGRASVHAAAEDEFDRASASEMVDRALRRLNARQRRELLLRDVEGWSVDEIARFSGTTADSVRSSLKRSRARFRQAYHRRMAAFGGLVVVRRALDALGRILGPLPVTTAEAIALAAGVLLTTGLPSPLPVPVSTPSYLVGREAAAPTDVRPPPSMVALPRPPQGHASTGTKVPAVRSIGADIDAADMPNPDGYQLTPSPAYAEDGTVFASSSGEVLKSTDGGRTWSRRKAFGSDGSVILLPPGYPRDSRIFAQSAQALYVSVDDGDNFTLVTPLAKPDPVVFSPRFSDDDPRIFLMTGLQSVLQYHFDSHTVEPLGLPLPSGLTPTGLSFARDYAVTRNMFVSVVSGTLEPGDLLGGRYRHRVFSCSPTACMPVLDVEAEDPYTRLHPTPGGLLVFDWKAMYRWDTASDRFVSSVLPDPGYPWHTYGLVSSSSGRLFAAGWAGDFGMPLVYVSSPGGRWKPVYGLDGSRQIVNSMVAPADGAVLMSVSWYDGDPGGPPTRSAVLCSVDGGLTWTPGCPSAAAISHERG